MNTKVRKDTRVHLVEELLKVKQYPEIVYMIEEARAGEFHDYKNKKYTCGKFESVTRLQNLSNFYKDRDLWNLALRIADGEFDEEADEEDKAMMRDELRKDMGDTAAYRAMCKTLGL